MKIIDFKVILAAALGVSAAISGRSYYAGADQNFTVWNDGNAGSPLGNYARRWTTIAARGATESLTLNLGVSSWGVYSYWDTDAVFVGLVDMGSNRKDAVIAWGDDGDDQLRFLFNGNEKLRLTNGGSLGLGTVSPAARLHVYSPAADAKIRIESVTDASPGFEVAEAGTLKWSILNAPDDSLVFKAGAASTVDRLVLTSTGNLGVGTSSPTHKLSVNGPIRAKEIIVDTGWADDVFAPDYRLASLPEIEKHIQTNGHLPAVPSSAEVAEKGISVGETQAMLLRKIEELTLHVIALNKQVQEQQKRLAELAK